MLKKNTAIKLKSELFALKTLVFTRLAIFFGIKRDRKSESGKEKGEKLYCVVW